MADLKQLMAYVVEPAADEYWDAVGWIDDAQGTVEIEPKTQEEWDAVRNHAYAITESGNLMMLPTRAKDSDEWMRMSIALVEAGQRAIRAAEAEEQAGRLRHRRRDLRGVHELPREVRGGIQRPNAAK